MTRSFSLVQLNRLRHEYDPFEKKILNLNTRNLVILKNIGHQTVYEWKLKLKTLITKILD